jgi:hypothetical protein
MKQRQSSVSRGDIRSRAFIFSIYVFLPVSVSVYLVFLACFFFFGPFVSVGFGITGFRVRVSVGWLVGCQFGLVVCTLRCLSVDAGAVTAASVLPHVWVPLFLWRSLRVSLSLLCRTRNE